MGGAFMSKRQRKYSSTEESTDETEVVTSSTPEETTSSPILTESAPLNIAETAHNEVLKSALIEKLQQAPTLDAVMQNPWRYSEWLATVQRLVV